MVATRHARAGHPSPGRAAGGSVAATCLATLALALAAPWAARAASIDVCLQEQSAQNAPPAVLICSWDNLPKEDRVAGEYGGTKGELGTTLIVDINNKTTRLGKARLMESPEGYIFQGLNEDIDTCGEGLLLPFMVAESSYAQWWRLLLYLIALMWCFLGIAIIADMFMASIEVITSKERSITVVRGDREVAVRVLVWNETVANLTLMALGSSAPEILLAVIETCSQLGQPLPEEEGLGPGTIVGSAAFNLLCIIGICVVAIPDGGSRKIKEVGVFTVTAFFSVFAYVWLLFVLDWNTKGDVDMLEALATFFMFPLLVGIAYGQDVNWFKKKGHNKVTPHAQAHIAGTGGMGAKGYGAQDVAALLHDKDRAALAQLDEETLAKLATHEIMAHKRTTIATHRVQAGRAMQGAARVYVPRNSLVTLTNFEQHVHDGEGGTPTEDSKEGAGGESKADDKETSTISFGSPTYACLEDCGKIELTVIRTGKMDVPVSIHYETSDGTALAGSDYAHTSGTLEFGAGEEHKSFGVPIVDDNEFEPDENFYCTLRLPGGVHANKTPVRLGHWPVSEVTIINDDTPGEFSFEKPSHSIAESAGKVEVAVVRKNGSDGEVTIKYHTVDTPTGAVGGVDYKKTEGTMTFAHGEMRKTIDIEVIDDGDYEKDETFTLEFAIVGHPECGAQYGSHRQTVVTITNDEEFAKTIDKVAQLINLNLDRMRLDTATWGEQFRRAMEVAGEEGEPGNIDYVMHFLSFFWKVLFALVPPTSMKGGWVSFASALIFIGGLTAVVGDLASTFGCLLGLNDAVTAITFVALGTSLPDTFASKAAAVNDDYADASVGNVTGSNSVNVFLGLGLPWMIAAIYHAAQGTTYQMQAGSLSFSVTVFCVCAVFCIMCIYLRRLPAVAGAELGGPATIKYITGVGFFLLWVTYVTLSSLQSLGKL